MLTANIREMLQTKELKTQEQNKDMWSQIDRHIKVVRRQRIERIEKIAEQKQRQAMFDNLRSLQDDRNKIISSIQVLTIIRKDGKNVARSGMKDRRSELKNKLNQINKRIDIIMSKLSNKPMNMSYSRAKLERDSLAHKLVDMNNTSEIYQSTIDRVNELNEIVRPKYGYPKPPYARTLDYPQGGLWHAPHGGHTKQSVKDEHSRLVQYYARIIRKHGQSESTKKMLNHIAFLERMFRVMPLNNCTKKVGSKRYFRKVNVG